MEIQLFTNSSDNNVINKYISNGVTLEGTVRDSIDIVNPKVMIAGNDYSLYNYAYIPEFNRYYFIKEITNYRTNVWILSLTVDVLMSFKAYILNLKCIIENSEVAGADSYILDSNVWVTKVKDKTDIINFPSGLLQNGEYVLITAGG